jgi:transposase-like protein
MTRDEKRARAVEMMRSNRYTLADIRREIHVDASSLRTWARAINWRTPQALLDAARVLGGRNSNLTRQHTPRPPRGSHGRFATQLGQAMALAPESRTAEGAEAQLRAVEHARRCAKLPPVTRDEADALVARFLAARGATQVATPCGDYSAANNFGEGW